MRRKFIYICVLLLGLLAGCNNTLSQIGVGFISSQAYDVQDTDSVTLHVSTVKYDSVVTSSSSRLLVGYHQDEELGPVSSFSVFQVTPPTSATLDLTTTQYYALSLHLIRDTYSYYDTTENTTLSVYRLNKQPYNGSLYNVDKFSADPTPLGSFTFQPLPHKKDSVEIYLSDDLGRQLMSMAQQSDPNLISSANFVKFFNGLVLAPDTTKSGCFLGFKTTPAASMQMRLYYRDFTVAANRSQIKWLSFSIGPGALYYNKIHGDRSATPLAPLQKSTDFVSSYKTGHETYLQGGTGVGIRIDIPYVQNLLYIQNNFQCTKAVLSLKPTTRSYLGYSYLPAQISGNLVDATNQLLVGGYVTGSLFTDALGNSSYSVDITTFVNNQIVTEVKNNNALLFQVPAKDLGSTVNRLGVGDPLSSFQMKLTVYYLTLLDQ